MKKSKADEFFNAQEREKIKDTTHAAEARTIGEIAVMVVDGSDRYVEAEITGGVIFSAIPAFILTEIFFHSSIWSFIPLCLLFFPPFRLLSGKSPAIKSAFTGRKRKNNAVRERAVRAFYEKGLYKTKKNTGVLFFLSLLERKVWVLADKGIYEKIQQARLNELANTVSRGIRDNRACDALCEAIKEAGELLAGHFPITSGDTDELTNDLMTE